MPATAADLQATARFIDYRPVDVEVSRKTRVATPDGGSQAGPPDVLAAQTIRIVEKLPAQATQARTNDDGDTVFASHVGVALPDADFQRKDTFIALDERWEVIHVSRLPEWRLSLELYSRGRP